jgi:hypothetical protein
MILLVYSITTAGAVVVGFFLAVAYPMLYLYCLPLFMDNRRCCGLHPHYLVSLGGKRFAQFRADV